MTASRARSVVLWTTLLGFVLVTAGGITAARDTRRIHDWGELSFDSPGVITGLIIVGLGGLVLLIPAVATGVYLGNATGTSGTKVMDA